MDTTTEATRRIEESDRATRRKVHVYALAFWLLSLVAFWKPLRDLVSLSFRDENSSHLVLIPLITAGLLLLDRDRIFRTMRYRAAGGFGALLILIAAVLCHGLRIPFSQPDHANDLTGAASLIVLLWIGGFVLFYGPASLKQALFPMLFLLLMVPIPAGSANHIVTLLQRGSADTCDFLFRVIGVPFLRSGFRFSLPGVDIEVAEQCSGIHSALALFIAGLLLQHFLLAGTWKKVVFTAAIFPVAIFKNAVRIVTIAWLGVHVNPEFFHGQLHRRGGLPFAVVAVAILGVLLWALRRVDFGMGRKEKTTMRSPEVQFSGR